jgi:hypothetical protein
MNDEPSKAEQTEQTRELLVAFYAALRQGSFPLEFYDQDIVVEIPAFLPHGGIHRGLPDLLANLAKGAGLVDLATIRVEELIADGEHGFVAIRLNIIESDEESVLAEHWRVRGDKLVYMKLYIHDPRPVMNRMRMLAEQAT